MGAKTKTVGGNQYGGMVSDQWNRFLLDQLNPSINAANTAQNSNAQQPQQQTSNFANNFNGAMSGQINDQSGANAAIQNFFKNPNNNFQLPQFNNPYNAPTYQGVNTQQLPTNFGQGQTGMADLSSYGNAAQSNFRTDAPLSSIGSGFDTMLKNMLAAGGGGANGFSAASIGAAPNMTPQMTFGEAMGTMGADPHFEMARQRAVADQRARFGAEGIGSLGTGAQYGEALLNSDLIAQDASNRRGQALQLMGQDLAGKNALTNNALQGRSQDAQVALGNMQGGLQGAANQNNALSSVLSTIGQARGQDLSTGLGVQGNQLTQQGQGLQQSMFNAGQQNTTTANIINAILQNQGMGNSFGLNAAALNNGAMQNNNANAINQNQYQNTFNMNNAANGAQYGMGTNQLNSQNLYNAQNLNNNMLNSMIANGLNLNSLGNNNMMSMLASLMGGFQQNNALNTAQRQTVTSPSALGQFGNMFGQLAGNWLAGGGGNPFSRGNSTPNIQIPQVPNINIPGIGVPTPMMLPNTSNMPTLQMGDPMNIMVNTPWRPTLNMIG